jgi:uncharacterized membrane protein YgdD (TMEM256/DUF423 family)
MKPALWIAVGALLAALGVAIGAFGAHILPGWLANQGREPAAVERAVQVFETAVRYQMYQAIGLILLGLWQAQRPARGGTVAGYLMLAGCLVFSGLLYALVVTDVKVLGAIVPIGGVMMIAGWATWSVAAWRSRENA